MTDAGASAPRRAPPVWLIGWVLAATILCVNFGAATAQHGFADPDNAMWLVGVRDILNGQGWWDGYQHRLNPPQGTELHWARWVAFVMAAPIAVLTPLFGSAMAETMVAFVWPLGLLAAFIALIARISGEVGASDGLRRQATFAGAIVAALAFPVTEKFAPGAFDHHGLVLVFSLIAVLGLVRFDAASRSAGLMAGVGLGLAMSTAAEGLPVAAAGMLAAGLLWLFRPARYRDGLMWLGAGLAASTLACFVMMVPPARWGAPVCDAMSASFLGFGLAAGGVAALLARVLPRQVDATLAGRMGAAAVLGGGAIGELWLLFPDCAGGGYSALDADMQTYWLAQIAEARSLADLVRDDPATILIVAGSVVSGFVAAGFYLSRRWRAGPGWVVLILLIMGAAMMVWQIRGSFFASAFAVPFGAWAVVRSRQAWRASGRSTGLAVFALTAATATAASWSAVSTFAQPHMVGAADMQTYTAHVERAEDCIAPVAYRSLDDIPPSVMLNSFILGHNVLLHTAHSATAAPYHRDADGLMTMIAAMRSDSDAARSLVTATAAEYVLVCNALPEMSFYRRHPQDGVAPDATLAARLVAGDLPEWLRPVEITGTPLRLYRIVR